MNVEFRRVKEIFLAAVEQAEPAQRDAFVRAACGPDEELRRRVEALLARHALAGSFLESPAGEPPATVDERPTAETPGTVIGPYKLLEQIGEGGFGTVFMAEQTRPVRRKVALKVLKPGMDTRQVVARFEAERQALAMMDHPNIAKVFDGGATSLGRPYFVMELVRGVPITDFCDQKHLTPRQRLGLFVDVCRAVQHAHQKGIIHRDLKPSNILVVMHDTTPVPKVIDFGIAKALGQELTDKTLFTAFAQMVGTPLYMSPEQAGESGLDVDTRSDVYSLGVLLYELLTGTTPFDGERFRKAGYDEVRRIIREEEPPKPSTRLNELGRSGGRTPLAPGPTPQAGHSGLASISALRRTEPARLTRLLRGELDWIVMKALEKDRSRRYETANGFAMDVQRYLADEPVQACPPSARYRLSKFARKYKKALAIAAAFAVLSVIGIVISTSLALWARSAEREATDQRIVAEAEKDQAEKNFAEAQRQRAQSDAHLYRSLLGEARAIREARGSSYRVEAWKRLGQALRLEMPERDSAELRREAGACLGDFIGLEPTDWIFPADTWSVAYDLHPDGELLAIVFGHQPTSEVLLRNVVSGEEVLRFGPERGRLTSVKFSADGKRLFAGATNGLVKVWQVDFVRGWGGAKPLSAALPPNPAALRSRRLVTPSPVFPFFIVDWWLPPISELAVSPDGTQLAACSRYGPGISVWNLADGSPARAFSTAGMATGEASIPTAMAFSPRGDLLAVAVTADNSDGVLVWNVATRKVRQTLRPGLGVVNHVCFSADGKSLACTCREGVALFDAVDFHHQQSLRGDGGWGGTRTSAFSPDGRLLAIPALESGVVRLRDLAANREASVPIPRDPSGPAFVRFSPDGQRLVSAGSQSVRIWNLAAALEKQTLPLHSGGIPGLAFSPDGKLLAASCKDNTVRLWDPATRKVVRELRGFNGPPQSVAFDPDGRYLATTVYTGGLKVWEVQSGRDLSTSPDDLGPAHYGASFSPDGKYFVVCGLDGLKIWRVVHIGPGEDGRPRLSLKEAACPTQAATNSACFSADGKLLAWAGAWDRAVARGVSVWDLATGQERSWPASFFPFLALSFLPDGKHLALVNWDEGMIEVRNATDGQLTKAFGKRELIQGRSIHTALSPDGVWIAVGGDKAVTVWDVNKSELLFVLPEERGTIWSLAWSPDQSLLAVGSSDGGLALWHVPTIKSELSRIGLGW